MKIWNPEDNSLLEYSNFLDENLSLKSDCVETYLNFKDKNYQFLEEFEQPKNVFTNEFIDEIQK